MTGSVRSDSAKSPDGTRPRSPGNRTRLTSSFSAQGEAFVMWLTIGGRLLGRPVSKPVRLVRLGLESLEDRTVPSGLSLLPQPVPGLLNWDAPAAAPLPVDPGAALTD